jgi:hypothetical protein
MFRTLKSNSPFSAPRDDTARASCGNGAKRKILSFEMVIQPSDQGLLPGDEMDAFLSAAIVETRRRLPGKEDIWNHPAPENHSPETKAVIGH